MNLAGNDLEREYYHGGKRVAHYRKTGEIPPPGSYEAPKFNVPTIQVSTDGEYIPCIDEIVRQIQSSDAQQSGTLPARQQPSSAGNIAKGPESI